MTVQLPSLSDTLDFLNRSGKILFTHENNDMVSFKQGTVTHRTNKAFIDQLELVTPKASDHRTLREDALFFGETQSRAVMTVRPEEKEEILRLASKWKVPLFQIGRVTSPTLVIGDRIRAEVKDLHAVYHAAIPGRMAQ